MIMRLYKYFRLQIVHCLHYGPIQKNGFKEASKVYKFCLKTYKFSLIAILFFQYGNLRFWGIFQADILFLKLWPLLYKRVILNLSSTK